MSHPDAPKGPIDIKKLIESIDLRFVSGNNVPVERAHVRVWEWAEIKQLLAKGK
jgi:hypothetical protein